MFYRKVIPSFFKKISKKYLQTNIHTLNLFYQEVIITIYKAYKFRIYPNNEQEKVLNSFLGSSRFIFNYYIKLKDKLYKEKNINYKLTDIKKDLVPLQTTYPWLKEVDGCILRTALEDLDRAFDNFYSKRASYPKYKKYGKNESYRTVCIRGNSKGKEYQNITVDLKKRKIDF